MVMQLYNVYGTWGSSIYRIYVIKVTMNALLKRKVFSAVVYTYEETIAMFSNYMGTHMIKCRKIQHLVIIAMYVPITSLLLST